MLHLNQYILPKSTLSSLVFRISFCETLDRLTLARQFPSTSQEGFGYLTEVPFLANVAPAVQLELLARTWHRHRCPMRHEATLLDECVLFAACERAAWCLENESFAVIQQYLQGAPFRTGGRINPFWPRQIRELHEEIGGEADFLLLGQFVDLPPWIAEDLREGCGITRTDLEPLFEALGRWHPSPEMSHQLAGLLTEREIELVSELFRAPLFAD